MYYYSLNKYLKDKFGSKVYKISLSANVSCPNRDGKIDTRGCIFCSKGGSGDFASDYNMDIDEQIKQAKQRVSSKYKGDKYIAYFQSFTNTYAKTSYLKMLYESVIIRDDIVALSIATRPDCLPNDILELIQYLNSIKPVWVELGFQTSNEQTANYIRRGYNNECFKQAVNKLTKIGVHVVAHVILGLPNETQEDMLNTVDFVAHSGANGIKLHLLHVLKDTDLYTDYINGKFETLTQDKYIEILGNCIERLPRDMVIHRMTGDGPKKILVSPKWSSNKKVVLNSINKYFNDRNIEQGSKFL